MIEFGYGNRPCANAPGIGRANMRHPTGYRSIFAHQPRPLLERILPEHRLNEMPRPVYESEVLLAAHR
jgi:hypothetical protein